GCTPRLRLPAALPGARAAGGPARGPARAGAGAGAPDAAQPPLPLQHAPRHLLADGRRRAALAADARGPLRPAPPLARQRRPAGGPAGARTRLPRPLPPDREGPLRRP